MALTIARISDILRDLYMPSIIEWLNGADHNFYALMAREVEREREEERVMVWIEEVEEE